ncbi:hypothetical protein SDC9_146627 [bioreactor metagenome]|uniref:Uncharacterized protein n=1 Tax=bioreactor metagenome TaxID=1076179 RepID=A0A645ECL1_9ZZZZ
MLEEVGAGHARGEVRRVGEGGHLVAEITAGNDDADRQRRRDSEAESNAEKGDAYRSRRAPRGSCGKRDDGANDERREKEDRRREYRQPVVDHARHDAAADPGTDERADRIKDKAGLHADHDAVNDSLLDL